MMNIFIILIILTSKLVLKSFSYFFLSEQSLEYNYQQLYWSWFFCSQWKQYFLILLLFLKFNFFLLNWVIILLKLKLFSSFAHLLWLIKAMIISLINSLNLLILILCIKSKMYNIKLLLKFKRKRLFNIHDFTVFSTFKYLITVYLSELT